MSDKPKRRWFQFSLRMLLVVFTLFALWLGWTMQYLRSLERQWEVVERMKEANYGESLLGFQAEPAMVLGSSIPSRLNPKWQLVRALDLADSRSAEAPFREISSLSHLTRLKLNSRYRTDEALASLGSLHELRDLSISSEKVTGKFLAEGNLRQTLQSLEIGLESLDDNGALQIGSCLNLRKLALTGFPRNGAHVTDWSFLSRSPQLEELELGDDAPDEMLREVAKSASIQKLRILSAISESGVVEISRSRSIEDLVFCCLIMSDSTVDKVRSMKQLKKCVIVGMMSHKALLQLKKTHPGCTVLSPSPSRLGF